MCNIQERSPPLNYTKKPRTNNEHRRSNSARQSRNDLPRNAWDDGITVQGSVEGPISPVNYAGTQINIWGTPGGNLTEGLLHVADPSRNPNFGYMTEEMLQVNTPLSRIRFLILIVAITTIEKSTHCSTSTTAYYRCY